jgi:hypothetical protein
MDCITCHHSLTGYEKSWRQKEGYDNHRPGDPPYNEARFAVFQHVATEIDSEDTKRLEENLRTVSHLITTMSPDRTAVATAAGNAAEAADNLVAKMRAASYDRERTMRLMRDISADGKAISEAGERTAEQAAMTLDSLYIASAKDGAGNEAVRSAIDGLFKDVNNPSAYNGQQFAQQMRKVHDALR